MDQAPSLTVALGIEFLNPLMLVWCKYVTVLLQTTESVTKVHILALLICVHWWRKRSGAEGRAAYNWLIDLPNA